MLPLTMYIRLQVTLMIFSGFFWLVETLQRWNTPGHGTEAYLSENPRTKEQEAILSEISDVMSLTAMEDPFRYVKELQETFDYDKIRYTEEYHTVAAGQAAPVWKVRFFNHPGENRDTEESAFANYLRY